MLKAPSHELLHLFALKVLGSIKSNLPYGNCLEQYPVGQAMNLSNSVLGIVMDDWFIAEVECGQNKSPFAEYMSEWIDALLDVMKKSTI